MIFRNNTICFFFNCTIQKPISTKKWTKNTVEVFRIESV